MLTDVLVGCEAGISAHALILADLHRLIANFYTAVPLQSIELEQAENGYQYTIRAADGRVWRQHVIVGIDAAHDRMTFQAQVHWELREFAEGRELRAHLLDLIRSVSLYRLKVTFA